MCKILLKLTWAFLSFADFMSWRYYQEGSQSISVSSGLLWEICICTNTAFSTHKRTLKSTSAFLSFCTYILIHLNTAFSTHKRTLKSTSAFLSFCTYILIHLNTAFSTHKRTLKLT